MSTGRPRILFTTTPSRIEQIQRDADDQNRTVSSVVAEIVDRHYDSLSANEDLYLSTITRLNRKVNSLDTKVAVAIECIFQFVKLYLVHTPTIPPELIKERSTLAGDRFNKYFKGLESNLSSDVRLLARLMESFLSEEAPEAAGDSEEKR